MSEGTWNLPHPEFATKPWTIPAPGKALEGPVFLRYAPGHRARGLAWGVLGMSLLGVGLFLLSQMTSTPLVAVQLCAVGLLLTGLGVGFLHRSVLRVLGGLGIDAKGIALSPGYAGFAIPWGMLDRWEIRDENFPLKGLPMARFWVKGEPTEFSVPAESLRESDLDLARAVLRTFAPECEVLRVPAAIRARHVRRS